jgi:site-specific recombinase XerD
MKLDSETHLLALEKGKYQSPGSVYTLRHSFATQLIPSGIDISVV